MTKMIEIEGIQCRIEGETEEELAEDERKARAFYAAAKKRIEEVVKKVIDSSELMEAMNELQESYQVLNNMCDEIKHEA